MGLANGVNHLAIVTKDIKRQIEFFTQVVGAELEALYWMHGASRTFHGFIKLSDSSSIAFVQGPASGIADGARKGLAPGQMQHVALNVDTEEELLAIRDRIRAAGYSIAGPIDHGFCKSIYMAAPENISLEFCTANGRAIDAEAWIDPEVVREAGISADDLRRFKSPPAFKSQDGRVPQVAPEKNKLGEPVSPRLQTLFSLSDREVLEKYSEPIPPVEVTRKSA
jgi:catechol 2,3-dioxygenase-like lactoylglutathione lyase family enzyme